MGRYYTTRDSGEPKGMDSFSSGKDPWALDRSLRGIFLLSCEVVDFFESPVVPGQPRL